MPQNPFTSRDLTRTVLGVLCIAGLILSTVWILRPFVSAFLWATMIVISTWPLMLAIQARLGRRRGLATAVMTIALLLILLIPMTLALGALVGNMDSIVAKVSSLKNIKVPPPPDWVAGIPLQGPALSEQWQRLSEEGPGSFSAQIKPYAVKFLEWSAGRIGGIGAMVLQFFLTVIIAAVLYVKGETAALGVRKFAYRLAGDRGDRAVVLAANTIRGVAMGVVLTAVIQTIIAALGFVLSSSPSVGLLTAVVLMFCIAQLGPILVMLPVVIWKYYAGASFSGTVLLVFMIVAGTIDNFIRPVLIRKGADLPLPLIILGVIGGLISFGIMGIFVGPVILAVTYVLIGEWIENPPSAAEAQAPAE